MAPEVSKPIDVGFEVFTRARWAALARHSETISVSALRDPRRLGATGEPISLQELTDIYLPLSQFLRVMAEAKRALRRQVDGFLGHDRAAGPFIIGIAGGVAVGKSTTSRSLQALLREGAPNHAVELLTTDGFLYPNATLEARGLMERKGFPESYHQRLLITTLAAIRAGAEEVATPVYSHLAYDIVPGETQIIRRPDILIVEGLNVLQVNTGSGSPLTVVSDFFDFSIYVDAAEMDIAAWFYERLAGFRSTLLQDPDSYFHRFAGLTEEEASAMAQHVWNEINLVNLRENVAPTRNRAHLVLEKDGAHRVQRLLLKKI